MPQHRPPSSLPPARAQDVWSLYQQGRNLISLFEFMQSHEVDYNQLLDDGQTLLHHAVQWPNYTVLEWMLEHGADPNLPDENGRTPLILATDHRAVRLMRIYGASFETPEAEEAVYGAWIMDNSLLLSELLDGGAGVSEMLARDVMIAKGRIESAVSQHLLEHLKAPEIDTKMIKKAHIFDKNGQDFAAWQHPSTWHQWPEVAATLQARGEVVTKADLLDAVDIIHSPFYRAAECYVFDKVVKSLNLAGEGVGAAELLDEGGELSALGQAAVEMRACGVIFSVENARCLSNPAELLRIHEAIPPQDGSKIYNIHSVVESARRQQRQAQNQQGRT